MIAIPVAVALLITRWCAGGRVAERDGIRRGVATILVVATTFGLGRALLTFAGQQVATGGADLADQTVKGLQQIKDWLKDGPLNASDAQIDKYLEPAQDAITEQSAEGGVLARLTELGTAVGHVLAGFFIVLFSTFFFLADGDRIWAWMVRLAPRAARERVDSAGRVAWIRSPSSSGPR